MGSDETRVTVRRPPHVTANAPAFSGYWLATFDGYGKDRSNILLYMYEKSPR